MANRFNDENIIVSGGGFIVTGPNQASLRPVLAGVRKRIAFYASTRTYFPVLECHGFLEIGQQLHQMSIKGQWDEMGELVSDEMLDAFAVTGEYGEVADKLLDRYRGLLDEISFSVESVEPPPEDQLRKIIRRLKEG